jgi:hypothetical protein
LAKNNSAATKSPSFLLLPSASSSLQDLDRAGSLQSELSSSRDGGSSGVYGSRHDGSEVYSIPAALPDPQQGARNLMGSVSVPSKLSVARGQVPDSSEVYGTRAGLLGEVRGGRPVSNRLLNDIIMANYNNM